jgi:hypothetical protein
MAVDVYGLAQTSYNRVRFRQLLKVFLFDNLESVGLESVVVFPLPEIAGEFSGVIAVAAGGSEKDKRIVSLVLRVSPADITGTEISITFSFGVGTHLDSLKLIDRLTDGTFHL